MIFLNSNLRRQSKIAGYLHHFYLLRKKLQRGNDFSRVCLSFCLSVCLCPGEDAGDSPVMTRGPVQACSLGDPPSSTACGLESGQFSTEGLLAYLIRYTYLARRCFICPAKKLKQLLNLQKSSAIQTQVQHMCLWLTDDLCSSQMTQSLYCPILCFNYTITASILPFDVAPVLSMVYDLCSSWNWNLYLKGDFSLMSLD